MAKTSNAVRKVNIGGNANDKFHRYKREEIQVKKEALATIVNAYAKTTITNIPQIAQDIDRPITYITKYFGGVMGTQTKYDKKTKTFVLNGQHSLQDLEVILEGFIEGFVLCASCGNPETDIVVKDKKDACLECRACGHTTEVSPRYKLTNYVIKNPPKLNKKSEKAKTKPSKKPKVIEETTADVVDQDTEETWTPTIDTSEEAVKSRLQQEGLGNTAVQQLTLQSAKEKLPKHPVAHLKYDLGLNANDTAKDVELSNDDLKAKIDTIKKSFKLDRGDCICLMFDTLINSSNISEVIPKRKEVFANFMRKTKDKRVFLRCVEYLIQANPKDLLGKVGPILNTIYESDLIDDSEIFMEWFESKTRKKKRAFNSVIAPYIKPFVDWLAEDDDSDEESDEDESDDTDSDDE